MKVNQPLDFERIKEYNLTIRVEVSFVVDFLWMSQCHGIPFWLNPLTEVFSQNNGAQQLASEATIFIVLEDVNDEIPLFTEREQETVMEGEPVGTPVTRLVALSQWWQ